MKPSNSLTSAIDHLLPTGPNFSYCVDAAALAFKIGPHQHFSDQPDAEQHQSSKPEHRARNHEGPVLSDDVMAADLFDKYPEKHNAAKHNAREPPFAEEMHGPRQVTQQESNRQDVEKYSKSAA